MTVQSNWVRSELLPWVTDIAEVHDFARNYGVGVEVLPERTTTFAVRITGERSAVRHCIREQWCSNTVDGSAEQEDEIDMYLGDSLATHRFSTGCEIGRDGDMSDYEQLNEEKFMWSHHWTQAGGFMDPDLGDPNSRAIDFLSTAGITPEQAEEDHVTRAQSYLQLAFHYVPSLMELNIMAPVKPERKGVPQLGDATVEEIMRELVSRVWEGKPNVPNQ